MSLPLSFEADLDADIAGLIRAPAPPRCTSGDEKAVQALRSFGHAHEIPAAEIALAMNLLRGANDVLIILQQPASNHAYTGTFEAQVAASPTLSAVDQLVRVVTRGTRSLATVSVADSSAFNPQPRGPRHRDDVEPFRARGHALLGKIVAAKKPSVALCLWTGGCESAFVRRFRGARVGAPLAEAGDVVPLPGGHLVSVVRSFHPSYAVNFHPEKRELRKLLLLDFARAFGVLENRWREESWIVRLRIECRRFAKSCGDGPRALAAAEEGARDLALRDEEAEEDGEAQIETPRSDDLGDRESTLAGVVATASAHSFLVHDWERASGWGDHLLTLSLLDLCGAEGEGTDGLSQRWAKLLHPDRTDRIHSFLTAIAAGHDIDVRPFLAFFVSDITDLSQHHLLHPPDGQTGRYLLLRLLEVFSEEARVGILALENYFLEPWERWRHDPVCESESYYEHEEKLAVDAEYAQTWGKHKEERERRLALASLEAWQKTWEALFERAVGFVTEGPRDDFRRDRWRMQDVSS